MTTNRSFDQAALAFKVLDGKASPEEQSAFEAWLSQKQEHWEEFADLKLLWENSCYESNELDPDAFEQIKKIVVSHRRNKQIIRFIVYLLSIIVVAGLIYFFTSRSIETHQLNLRFDDVTVEQVIKEIESLHHVEIECDNAIRSCRFSGIFYRSDKPEIIISAIASSLNLQILKPSVNTFRLTGAGCQQPLR